MIQFIAPLIACDTYTDATTSDQTIYKLDFNAGRLLMAIILVLVGGIVGFLVHPFK